jgi:hypothetical protein
VGWRRHSVTQLAQRRPGRGDSRFHFGWDDVSGMDSLVWSLPNLNDIEDDDVLRRHRPDAPPHGRVTFASRPVSELERQWGNVQWEIGCIAVGLRSCWRLRA